MAARTNYWVYRFGANLPTAPMNSYQILDVGADLLVPIEGDFIFAKDTKILHFYNGTTYQQLAPAPPVVVPPLNHSLAPGNYSLTNADNVLLAYGINSTITLHPAATALVKRYTIKAWNAATGVKIKPAAGDLIDASAEKILNFPEAIDLFPITGTNVWVWI